jgi:flotillin
VAEARYKGDVGEKERQGQTRREVSRIETETYIYENERKQEVERARAELNVRLADLSGKVRISQVEASQASDLRLTELQRAVEEKRIQLETERIRATEVAKATVEFECSTKSADAALYSKKQEAQGVKTMFEARAHGLKELVKAFRNKPKAALQYLMLEKNLFRKLAQTNAEAVQGLKPNITVWSTGDPGKC